MTFLMDLNFFSKLKKIALLQFGYGYNGFDSGNSFFQKHRISNRLFSRTILERSNFSPVMIFAYSGYCQLCFRLESVWQSVVEDIEPLGTLNCFIVKQTNYFIFITFHWYYFRQLVSLTKQCFFSRIFHLINVSLFSLEKYKGDLLINILGYGIGTVNAMSDGNLLERLRVSRLPSIVVVVEGRVIHYRGNMQCKSFISFFIIYFIYFMRIIDTFQFHLSYILPFFILKF